MSVTLTGKDELLSYFGIPDVRYQPFETYYTIRKLNDGCLESGDKLFRAIFKRLHLNDIQFRETSKGKIMKIDHYNLKGYFYKTADFGISYAPGDDRRGDVKTSIKFRVALKNVKIGGSLNYDDLGLENDKDVEKFSKEFEGLHGVRPIEEAIRYISQRIIDKYSSNLYEAMAREIQEEGTPDKAVAKTIGSIVRTLRLVGFRLDRNASWQTIVNFEFQSSEVYTKVREMDEFCCNIGGKLVDVYFIYGGGTGRSYITQLPYSLPTPSPLPVKRIPKIVPMTATVNYMKSLSPGRREEAKAILAPFVHTRIPLKTRVIPFVPKHISAENIVKMNTKLPRASIHSFSTDSLYFMAPEWKPIEPYLDVLRDWSSSDSDSDQDSMLKKKRRKTRRVGEKRRSPTGPQRRTVRRRDKKESSK
jgi:hypothetical protein